MPILSKLGLVFRFFIVVVIYLIIFYSLKIMKNDLSQSSKRKQDDESIKQKDVDVDIVKSKQKQLKMGLEILDVYKMDNDLKIGSIIPVHNNLTIGRHKKNNISLPDPYVSNYHARLYKKDDKVLIKDNKSTNGIEVNDDLINKEQEVEYGDIIRIGNYSFRVIG
ncbi:FHA domain-containing protein [Clostridium sp. DL1XJH146]